MSPPLILRVPASVARAPQSGDTSSTDPGQQRSESQTPTHPHPELSLLKRLHVRVCGSDPLLRVSLSFGFVFVFLSLTQFVKIAILSWSLNFHILRHFIKFYKYFDRLYFDFASKSWLTNMAWQSNTFLTMWKYIKLLTKIRVCQLQVWNMKFWLRYEDIFVLFFS